MKLSQTWSTLNFNAKTAIPLQNTSEKTKPGSLKDLQKKKKENPVFTQICKQNKLKFWCKGSSIQTYISHSPSCLWPSWSYFSASVLKLFVTLDLRPRPHLNSESHLWSEGLRFSETLHRQPVTLEHNRIKPPYEQCHAVCIRFPSTQTLLLSPFIFLFPWSAGNLLGKKKHGHSFVLTKEHTFTSSREATGDF